VIPVERHPDGYVIGGLFFPHQVLKRTWDNGHGMVCVTEALAPGNCLCPVHEHRPCSTSGRPGEVHDDDCVHS